MVAEITMYKSVLFVFSAIGPVYSLMMIDHEVKHLSQPLNNLRFHDNKLYVGGQNYIYVLDQNLSVLNKATTCTSTTSNCNNLNSLLLIVDSSDGKYLINCGTAYNGVCEVRYLDKLTEVITNDTTLVTSDKFRPVQGIITQDGNFMMAVTFAENTPLNPKNTKRYPISTRNSKTLSLAYDSSIYKTPYITMKENIDYVIYYKSCFKSDDYIYFTTNQKETLQQSNYTSKLVRLCKDDKLFSSYVDLPVICMYQGIAYKMLQTAVIAYTQSGKIFIGAYTRGNDPKNPKSQSVICTEKLSSLDAKLDAAMKMFVINMTRKDPTRYLTDSGAVIKEVEYKSEEFMCNVTKRYDIKYAIGTANYELHFAYKTEEKDGYITTLNATKLDGHDVLLAGTSKGHFFQFNLEKKEQGIFTLKMFNKQIVDEGSEIKSIKEDGESVVYIMSSSKLFKLKSTDCTEFNTCQETMAKRNPHCGWCVFEDRASRNETCHHWIHSFQKCITLDASINGTRVGTTGEKVNVTANHFEMRTGNDTYNCKFSIGKKVDTSIATVINKTAFSCIIPKVSDHTEGTLELIVNNNVSLASTPFLFYSCDHYKRCKECVSTAGSMCTWSLTEPKCVEYRLDGIKHGNVNGCPQLSNNTNKNFIATGDRSAINIIGVNLPPQTSEFQYWCYVDNGVVDETASAINNSITCDISLESLKVAKKDFRVIIKYGQFKAERKDLDDSFMLTVTVYNCYYLADDCSHCKALNKDRYNCSWCSDGCKRQSCDETCPAPFIQTITPKDGPFGGTTRVTIKGQNFGTNISQITEVLIKQSTCDIDKTISYPDNDDFDGKVPDRIECTIVKTTDKDLLDTPLPVRVTVDGKNSNTNVTYTFKKPNITRIEPLSGPKAGSTIITIFGKNLAIGNRNWEVLFGSANCSHPEVVSFSDRTFAIKCISGGYTGLGDKELTLGMDGWLFTDLHASFKIVSNPNISGIEGNKGGFLSGGTMLTITGTDMDHANVGSVSMVYDNEVKIETCIIESPKMMKCKVPEAPETLKLDLMAKINKSTNRRKRDTCEDCIEIKITVKLDGMVKELEIRYVQDPSFKTFGGENSVLLYETDEHQLILKGDALNLITTKNDFQVTVGIENCTVLELTRDTLKCSPPNKQPKPLDAKNQYPEVNVHVGNINAPIGYLLYKEKIELYAIIAGAAGGALLFILVIVIIVGIVKYKKVGKKAKAYEKSLADMEMEIKTVARQEFLDMHTSMSTVNKNLVEQGFPYHSYQQFACNVMFSVDYLWTEPVVSNGKMTDDERLKANRGMESLESLIYNKFFLVSVISTMEREKRFFIREKSNFAGNLCAVLMGRMDYLDEILKLLMNNLVQETPAKKHKTLFRRCESITEKLLSNWLSLCLYPHVKSHSGSPLYLLYMATQKTMESGPIDAVTGDAKYTLSEEKLLKKWSSSTDNDNDKDLKFEAKTLTLNVVVDNGDEIFKCKVLDCDTISQVKNKCLNQIYVNFPASKLPVGASDLELEWHEGFGGTLKLRDEDNTSKRDGKWCRLNTLAHYNVKDESNMALIDPHSADVQNQEDYVNLANINMDGVCDGSIDSSQPLTLHDEENPHEYQQWHLVKKEEETSKQGKGAIAELYLNRLFTTKQSLMEYMRPLFDIVLDHDKCPPPTKFLYDYLDELGERYKVEAETVHAWKSHSYAIRVWASLMKMPNLLFDLSIPAFMDDNLGIISQVFIESFAITTQKFTKDTPPEKLIFHHERNHYRDRVKEFYKNVKVDPEDSDGFRQYMADVNRIQQGTEFNKVSALYRLYKQLKPYFEDILENLATNKESSNLQLDRKLEQVIAIMEEDD